MSDELIITAVIALLTSSAVGAMVAAWLNRKRNDAEVDNLESQSANTDAEAAAVWVDISMRLQKQRDLDAELFNKKVETLEKKFEAEQNALKLDFESKIKKLHEENTSLRKERDELYFRIVALTKRLEQLENGG